jgi:hypothetical protein
MYCNTELTYCAPGSFFCLLYLYPLPGEEDILPFNLGQYLCVSMYLLFLYFGGWGWDWALVGVEVRGLAVGGLVMFVKIGFGFVVMGGWLCLLFVLCYQEYNFVALNNLYTTTCPGAGG